jgi:hypothetical protein
MRHLRRREGDPLAIYIWNIYAAWALPAQTLHAVINLNNGLMLGKLVSRWKGAPDWR